MTQDNDGDGVPATEIPYKILVVDDEPDLERLVLQQMRREIRRGKYEFVFAHNGVEALEQLGRDRGIDLVVSDINMPKMDGLTLLENIPDVHPDVRSVIVSAYGDMKNIRTAMNRGAFDFVTKPIDFADLRVTIERTLRNLIAWREATESREKLLAIQKELDVARKMQQSILPTVFPEGPLYQVFGSMEPAREVGGDFFDIMRLEEGRIGITVADVSGKGVPAALFMMSCRTLLKGAAIGAPGPGSVLREVNELLNQDNEAHMFVTVFYAIFDPESGEFVYANGGHNSPLVVHVDGSSSEIPGTGGVALGVIDGIDYREDTLQLAPGEAVVLFTDGVTEAENYQPELFEIERLRQVFDGVPPSNAEETNKAVFEAVHDFAGDTPQSDDITCIRSTGPRRTGERMKRAACFGAAVLVAASVAFAGAAAAKADETGVSDRQILFGQSAAFSGPARDLGTTLRLGIEAAFEETNRQGGVHGRQLLLRSLDDAYEPEAAIANTRRLIAEMASSR